MASTESRQAGRSVEFVERTCCPVCHSTASESVFVCPFNAPPISQFIEKYYVRDPQRLAGWDYHIARCQHCGCAYQKWYGSDEFLAELYTDWLKDHIAEDIDTYRPWLRILARPWQSRDAQELMMLSSLLKKPLREMKTFDFGMGFGLWAQIASAIGCDSSGFDLSEACRAHARKKGVKIVAPEELPPDHFDVVVTENVFEHIADPYGVAAMLARSLAPGGMMKIAVPRGTDIVDRLKKFGHRPEKYIEKYTSESVNPLLPLEHLNAYSPATLIHLCRQFGLEPAPIPIRHRYAFLRSLHIPTRPVDFAKAFLYPWHRFHDPNEIYLWFQRA